MKQLISQVKRISQAVSGVDAHYQSSIPEVRKLRTGGGCEAGLADASLAAKQKDPHAEIVPALSGSRRAARLLSAGPTRSNTGDYAHNPTPGKSEPDC